MGYETPCALVDKCQFSEEPAASIYRVKNYTAHLGKKHGTGTEASGKLIREWLENLKEVANGISGGGRRRWIEFSVSA